MTRRDAFAAWFAWIVVELEKSIYYIIPCIVPVLPIAAS